jgi:hypothetical protein
MGKGFDSVGISGEHRIELEALISEMRPIAAQVGLMHSWWDVISDVECFLENKPTQVSWASPQELIAYCQKCLARNKR